MVRDPLRCRPPPRGLPCPWPSGGPDRGGASGRRAGGGHRGRSRAAWAVKVSIGWAEPTRGSEARRGTISCGGCPGGPRRPRTARPGRRGSRRDGAQAVGLRPAPGWPGPRGPAGRARASPSTCSLCGRCGARPPSGPRGGRRRAPEQPERRARPSARTTADAPRPRPPGSPHGPADRLGEPPGAAARRWARTAAGGSPVGGDLDRVGAEGEGPATISPRTSRRISRISCSVGTSARTAPAAAAMSSPRDGRSRRGSGRGRRRAGGRCCRTEEPDQERRIDGELERQQGRGAGAGSPDKATRARRRGQAGGGRPACFQLARCVPEQARELDRMGRGRDLAGGGERLPPSAGRPAPPPGSGRSRPGGSSTVALLLGAGCRSRTRGAGPRSVWWSRSPRSSGLRHGLLSSARMARDAQPRQQLLQAPAGVEHPGLHGVDRAAHDLRRSPGRSSP